MIISVFKNENDRECPVVIYISLKKDSSYLHNFNPRKSRFCSTSNFFYSQQDANMLSGLMEHVVINNKELFLDLIRDVVKQKK